MLSVSTWYGLPDLLGRFFRNDDSIARTVELIVGAESGGCANARNGGSSALGAAQFIDETWLRLIRSHRPDLAALSESEILDLRLDPDLSREIAAVFAERNAQYLRRRGLPVTAGTLYLSHFAGSAGAVAVLSAADSADAAEIMAGADSTGKMTRDKLVRANPFLESFTIADLKSWAERKMQGKPRKSGCTEAG